MTTSSKIKLIALIVALVGPCLAWIGYQEKTRLAELEAKGTTTEGVITGGEWKKGRKSGKTYIFNVAWKDAAGKMKTQDFRVTEAYFKAHATETEVKDEKVKVLYHPTKADQVILVGGSPNNKEMFPVGIGAFALGGCLLGFMALRRN